MDSHIPNDARRSKGQLTWLRSLLPGHPMYGADAWEPGTELPGWLERRAPGRARMPEGPALERRRELNKGTTAQARRNVKIARRDGGLTADAIERTKQQRARMKQQSWGTITAGVPRGPVSDETRKNMTLGHRRRIYGGYALGKLEEAVVRGETVFECKPDMLDPESVAEKCQIHRFKLNRVARDDEGKPVFDNSNTAGDFLVVDTDGYDWFAYDVALSMGFMDEKLAEADAVGRRLDRWLPQNKPKPKRTSSRLGLGAPQRKSARLGAGAFISLP